jgi:hypothetical protein
MWGRYLLFFHGQVQLFNRTGNLFNGVLIVEALWVSNCDMWEAKNSDYEEKCSEVFVYYKVHLRHFVLCNALFVYQAFLLFLKLLSVKNSVWVQKRGACLNQQ